MRIRKIDRYIFKEVMSPFLGGMFFLSFIFLMFQFLKMAEFFILHGVPIGTLMKVMGYLVITFLPLGLPIAMLLGVLIAFGRFSSDSEIVAMKASGMSLWRISVPVFVFSGGVAIFALLLNMNWAPWAETSMRKQLIKIGNSKFSSAIQAGTFTTGFLNLLLYTEKTNNRAGKMEKVFIYDERDPKHPLTVIAKTGELIRVQSAEDEVGGAIMQLQNGSIHQSVAASGEYNRINFGTYQIYVDLTQGNNDLAYKPKMLLLDELLNRRNESANPSNERNQYDTEIWRRISVVFMPIVFVLMGIGFGTVRTRGTRFGVFIVALITMGIYWQFQVSSIWLGEHGVMPAWIVIEIPNLLVGIAGYFAFRKASW